MVSFRAAVAGVAPWAPTTHNVPIPSKDML